MQWNTKKDQKRKLSGDLYHLDDEREKYKKVHFPISLYSSTKSLARDYKSVAPIQLIQVQLIRKASSVSLRSR